MSRQYKVSVLIITYNHERLISKAIDSVLMQVTDFEYQIVVGDDCSSDRTLEVLEGYQRLHPGKIKVVAHQENVGAWQNALDTLAACEATYVATLDGDDYWTSSEKLSKLASVLDEHPDCPMCFHNTQLIYSDGSPSENFWMPQSQSFFSTEELLVNSGAISSATMWRAECLKYAITETRGVTVGDKARAVVASTIGNVGYVDRVMSVWRIHKGGTFSSGDLQQIESKIKICNAWFQFYDFVDRYFEGKYNAVVLPDLIQQHYMMFKAYLRKGEPKKSSHHLSKMFLAKADKSRMLLSRLMSRTSIGIKLVLKDISLVPKFALERFKIVK